MKKVLLLAFTATMMLSACKKDKGNDDMNSSCQVVKFSESRSGIGGASILGGYLSGEATTVSYNSDGSLAKISDPYETRVFAYETDKMLASYDIKRQSGNNESGLLTYNYNSNKQIINVKSSRSSSDWSEDIEVTYSNNRITKVRTDYDNMSQSFTYNSNGEIEKIVEGFLSSTSEYLITYKDEKYTNPLIFELTFPLLVDGQGCTFLKYLLYNNLGNKERRLIDKITKGHKVYNYTYLKDERGNITKIIVELSGDIYKEMSSFDLEYNCK